MNPIQSREYPTTVELPAVSAQTLQAIVRTMLAQEPLAAKRIHGGLDVFLTSRILPTGELGVYLVESATQPGTFWQATSYHCGCPDAVRRGPGCRHARACALISAASAEADAEIRQTEFEARRLARQSKGA